MTFCHDYVPQIVISVCMHRQADTVLTFKNVPRCWKKGEASYSKLSNNIKSIPKDNIAKNFLLGKFSCFKYEAKVSSMKRSLRKTVNFILYSKSCHINTYNQLLQPGKKVGFLSQDSPFFK